MNKTICNQADYLFKHEIKQMNGSTVIPVSGAAWRSIEATEKPVYRSEIKQNDAGPTLEETVTVKTRRKADEPLRGLAAFPLVLRMQTNDETFYVGSPEYPAVLEVSGDRVFETFTFTAVSVQ
ncbi:MAG: hypothetical protein LBR08_11215 [Bacteroidales bacterium]|nr:hypothetical protein [Bacteroidales bacterium]